MDTTSKIDGGHYDDGEVTYSESDQDSDSADQRGMKWQRNQSVENSHEEDIFQNISTSNKVN